MNIRKIHENKQGKVSDKWDLYLDFYEELFHRDKDKDVSILEIGVQNGGSLDTYSEYFRNGKIFIGCDINENCSSLVYDDNRVKVVIGDANTYKTEKLIKDIESNFNFIIDDGSHQSNDIINSFVRYFPCVKPGGVYVIEDTHALYSFNYGGGLLNDLSAINLFKKLTDLINYEWWEDDVSISNYLATFFKGDVPNFIKEGWIQSLEFHNSIIAIHKSKEPSHRKIGKRNIAGLEYSVVRLNGVEKNKY